MAEHDGLVHAASGQTEMGEVAAATISGPGGEEASVFDRPPGLELLSARTLQNVVQGIIAEPAHRHWAADRFRLGRE